MEREQKTRRGLI